MRTGFIGLGAMGAPMAANLHRAGLLEAVYNRSAGARETFAREYGVAACDDPAALAARCEAIVLCVSADEDVLAVVRALADSLQSGSLVIDCSTIAADSAREAATLIEQAGGAFLDAPVSGGPEGAAKGTLTMMVGGAAAAFARAQPLFTVLGDKVVHMGAVGAGQATKAVNQVLAAGINQAVAEGLAFAEDLALPLDKVIDVVGSGAAGSWFINTRGPTMVRGEYAGFGFKLALHHKDLDICRRMAAAHGARLPLTEQTLADYARLMDAGHGDEDISALFRLQRGKMRGSQ